VRCIRAINFFQCLLIFFMNSQFSFSAAEDSRSSVEELSDSTEPRISCIKRCSEVATVYQYHVARSFNEAIRRGDNNQVSYYFLEYKDLILKNSLGMAGLAVLTSSLCSLGLYFLYSIIIDYNPSSDGRTGFVAAASSSFALGVASLVGFIKITSHICVFQKMKKEAKKYLVENLGVETFKKIENLPLSLAGVSELISILGIGDEEEAVATSFLGRKLEELRKQEARRCCSSSPVREGE
jgi:hypothetical protein